MSTIITRGELVIEPTSVTSITSQRESRNIVHRIIGRVSDDITLRPATLRTGTLDLVFAGPDSEELSAVAELAHAASGVFTIVSTDRPSLAFRYITAMNGRVTRTLEPATGTWTVGVDYQEIAS